MGLSERLPEHAETFIVTLQIGSFAHFLIDPLMRLFFQ
jgi:hypothetical protein